MPETPSHSFGMPCWIDAMVDSPDKHQRLMAFYSALYGWTFEVGPPESGHYAMAMNDGRAVMGLGQGPGTEGKMVTYFATDDIGASADLARSLGANVFVGPLVVGNGRGQLALVLDPVGAVHGLFQAGTFSGFGVTLEPGSPGWFDHVSTDPARAADYYAQVLDKELIEPQPGMRVLTSGEQWFASVSHDQLEGRDPMWNAIYAVDSLERARDQAVALGATVVMDEMPVPGGAISVIAEPVCQTMVTISGPNEVTGT